MQPVLHLSSLLILLAISCCFLDLVSCGGYMSVQFQQYNNQDSRCADGTYCDTVLFFNSRESACDPQFRLTADKFTPGGNGLFDYQQTSYYNNQDVINFGATFCDIANPVVIAMNYNDNPGSIQITITVMDKDTTVNDYIDTFSASLIASGVETRSLVMYSQPMLHSLSLRYWFTCHADYYGLLCNAYCLARNDALNGHYTCAADGQKVCLTGWIGASTDCKTPHPCGTGVCQNGAACVPQGEGYQCQCRADYAGANCQQFLNPCQYRNPCSNGAQCYLDAASQPQCRCPDQFTGALCDLDVNECAGSAGNPCSNGMPCLNTYGGFQCNCTDTHFAGSLCELPVCNGTVCYNNGTCSPGPDRLPRCLCADGFTGASCQTNVDDCVGSPCQNGATCRDLIADFACDCPAGFDGRLCERNVDDCAGSPCLNGGNCTDGVASFTCACQPGYSGRTCERPPAAAPNVTFDLLVGEAPGPEGSGGGSVSVAGVAAGSTAGFLLLVAVGIFLGVHLLRKRIPDSQIPDDTSSCAFSNAVYNNAEDTIGKVSSYSEQPTLRCPTVAVEDDASAVYEAVGGDRENQAYEAQA